MNEQDLGPAAFRDQEGPFTFLGPSRRVWQGLWAFPGSQSRGWFLESSFEVNVLELHGEVGLWVNTFDSS